MGRPLNLPPKSIRSKTASTKRHVGQETPNKPPRTYLFNVQPISVRVAEATRERAIRRMKEADAA